MGVSIDQWRTSSSGSVWGIALIGLLVAVYFVLMSGSGERRSSRHAAADGASQNVERDIENQMEDDTSTNKRKSDLKANSDIVPDRLLGGDTVIASPSSRMVRQRSSSSINSDGVPSSGEEDTPGTPDTPDNGGGGKMPADQSEGSDSREGANILQDCVNNDARDETDAAGDADINDVLDNDYIDRDELLQNNELESELDQPTNGDADDISIDDIDERDVRDINIGFGEEFKKELNRLYEIGQDSEQVSQLSSELLKFIVVLLVLVRTIASNIANYDKTTLCTMFNEKRLELGKAMRDALDSTENGKYKYWINLGSRFSIDHVILHFLHYAPPGSRHVDGDEYNFMRPDQCCVSVPDIKIPNFLIAEFIHGIETVKEWAFGGKTLQNFTSKQATVDMIPVLCEKGDSDSKMKGHYNTWTKRFGLENFYQLLIIGYLLAQMHILLAIASYQGTFQVLVMSSAVAKYIFGLGAGPQKYLTRIIGEIITNSKTMMFEVSFVCHPQAWMMGMVRSTTRFPKIVRDYMSENLVRVYSNVYNFTPGFTTKIMDHFGSKYAGLELGIYSRLAKLLDASDLLTLDDIAYNDETVKNTESESNAEGNAIVEFVKGKLQTLGDTWNNKQITSLISELKISSITLVMNRMRKFRAGCKLQYLAAQMSSNVRCFANLPLYMQSMVDAVASVLGQARHEVVDSLVNIKKAQIENGGRLVDYNKLVNDLARVFNEEGGAEAGDKAIRAVTSNEQFETFKALLGGTEEAKDDAIKAIKKVAKETDVTWWTKHKELVQRLNDNNDKSVSMITVDDNGNVIEVLYVKSRLKEGGDNKRNILNKWWADQVNLPGRVRSEYAIKAYEMKGSLYYLALKELGVCFDQRAYDDNLNVKAAIAALDIRDRNSDNAAVGAVRRVELNSNAGLEVTEEGL